MHAFIWPLAVFAVALVAAGAFLIANGRKYADRWEKKTQRLVNANLVARLEALERRIDKLEGADLAETVEALTEDVASMKKEATHVPDEAWMKEKLQPVFERTNVLSADLADLKRVMAKHEGLRSLGKSLSGVGGPA